MIALDLRDSRWTELVDSSPEALPYHHPSWSEVIAECYGYRPFALAATDAAGRVKGALPVLEVGGRIRGRRWVSLPFTDFCPPLSAKGAPISVAELDATRRSAAISRLEVKAELDGPGASSRSSGVMHTLELAPDPEVVFQILKRSQVARNIAKAEREGVVVRRGESLADLTEVYYGLHVRTRRRLGAPAQPRRFFDLLWRRMLEPGLGFVLLAYAGEQAIAGAVFLAWKETITYKFGASEASAWSLRPNHPVFWAAIRWGCENGFRQLDFGRTDLQHRGLRDFKSRWGATETPLVYTVIGQPRKERRGLGLQRAKETMIRRGPPSLARIWGELFYRYAA
jgi:CelD/BcsL family acetyltransferase involved in cellulose biosynthesis